MLEANPGERITTAGILFEELKKMIRERNFSVEILRGNHDPSTPQGVAWCADKAVLVTHGDAVYDEATPWSREFGLYRDEIRKIIEYWSAWEKKPRSHRTGMDTFDLRNLALFYFLLDTYAISLII